MKWEQLFRDLWGLDCVKTEVKQCRVKLSIVKKRITLKLEEGSETRLTLTQKGDPQWQTYVTGVNTHNPFPMLNGLNSYSAFLFLKAFTVQVTLTSMCSAFSITSFTLRVTQGLVSYPRTFKQADCRSPGIKLLTFCLVDDPLYFLSHRGSLQVNGFEYKDIKVGGFINWCAHIYLLS